MSKTYKYPCWKDNDRKGGRWAKRQASKAIRRYKGDIPDGYAFLKKIYNSWDIHDYRWVTLYKEEAEEQIQDYIDRSNEGRKSSSWLQGDINVYRKHPAIYKERCFDRDTIRKIEIE